MTDLEKIELSLRRLADKLQAEGQIGEYALILRLVDQIVEDEQERNCDRTGSPSK